MADDLIPFKMAGISGYLPTTKAFSVKLKGALFHYYHYYPIDSIFDGDEEKSDQTFLSDDRKSCIQIFKNSDDERQVLIIINNLISYSEEMKEDASTEQNVDNRTQFLRYNLPKKLILTLEDILPLKSRKYAHLTEFAIDNRFNVSEFF